MTRITQTPLQYIDTYGDKIPVVSTVTNLFYLTMKYASNSKSQPSKTALYQHITTKETYKCVLLLIPVLGNIAVALIAYRAKKQEEKNDQLVDEFIKNNQNLETLYQSDFKHLKVNDDVLRKIGQNLKNLKTLVLYPLLHQATPPLIVRNNTLKIIAENFNNLTHLSLTKPVIDNSGLEHLQNLTKLEILEIYDSVVTPRIRINDKGLQSLLIHKKLTLVSIDNCKDVTINALKALNEKLNEKRYRIINYGSADTAEEALEKFINQVNSKNRLYNQEVPFLITDETLAAIGKTRSDLKKLCLIPSQEEPVTVTNKTLKIIAENFPNLELLILSRSEITDDGLEHLKKLKNLEEVVLKDCSKLTPQAIKSLQQELEQRQAAQS